MTPRDEFTPAEEAQAEAEQAAADDARDREAARREALIEAYIWTPEEQS